MATAPISYGSDYASDQAGIDRARQYAALMQQQSMEQQPTQVVNGWAVPQGKSAGISKVVQALTGAIGTRLADQKQKDLTEKYQKDLQDTLSEAQKAYTGTPAVPGRTEAPLTPNDDEGNPNSPVQFQGQAAVAGDPMRYAQILMRHPATQQLGLQAAQQAMQRQQWAQLLGGDAGAAGGAMGGPSAAPGGMPTGGAQAAPGGLLAGTGIDPRAAQASLLADPTGKELMSKVLDARAKANEPVLQREGSVLMRQPDGSFKEVFSTPKTDPGMQLTRNPNGVVTGAQQIPGYGAGMAGIKGQEASAVSGAQAANDMVTVNTPQGPRMMTRAQTAQLAGGTNQMPGQGGPSGDPLSQLPPAFRRDIQRDMARNPGIRASVDIDPSQSPGVPGAMGAAPVYGAIPQPSNAPQPPAMSPQPAGPGIALQDDSQKAYGTARAGDFAKQASGLAQTGAAAGAQLRSLNELERIYADPNVAKGAVAENISGLKNLASSFGIDVKGLGGEQAAQAITNKMALDMRSTAEGGGMPGAMSDSDRNFLANMTPNLSKSPEGRKQIIANARKVAERQSTIAQMATQYEQQHGQLDVGFQKQMQDYANGNPLFTRTGSGQWSIRPVNN